MKKEENIFAFADQFGTLNEKELMSISGGTTLQQAEKAGKNTGIVLRKVFEAGLLITGIFG